MTLSGTFTIPQTADHLLQSMERGRHAAVFVVLSHPDPPWVGQRILFIDDGLMGSFQDAGADEAAIQLAREGLAGSGRVLPGIHTLDLEDGGEVSVYLELHHPPWELVIVGAGHLAQPLCTVGSLLGLKVRVLDDRPEFATRERFPEAEEVRKVDFGDPFAEVALHPWTHVLLVTRGHRYDFECLRKVLRSGPLPGYIGMIGSRRRVRATFEALLEEGFSRDLLDQVRAPIGLDIGGQTPAEIAISVAAELVHLWRGGTGRPKREAERILERFFDEKDPAGLKDGGKPDEQ
jgi:xanthine dehydrogenase accessory factor